MATTLTKWEPFGIELPSLWRRWLDNGVEPDGWMRVEEIHEDGDLLVRAELPGVDPAKDVEVTVADHVLHISAKREERSEHQEKDSYRSEFRYGAFARDIRLPAGVDQGAVVADYKDGILEVRVPWPSEPEASATKVPISRS
jgi:HSP20 family protein